VKIRPEIVDYPGWHVGIIDERAVGLPIGPPPVVKLEDVQGCDTAVTAKGSYYPQSTCYDPGEENGV